MLTSDVFYAERFGRDGRGVCEGAGRRSLPLLQSFYTRRVKAKRSPPGPAPTPLLCLALFSEAGQKIAPQVVLACSDLEWVGPPLGEELMVKWELCTFFCHSNTSLPFIIFFPSPSLLQKTFLIYFNPDPVLPSAHLKSLAPSTHTSRLTARFREVFLGRPNKEVRSVPALPCPALHHPVVWWLCALCYLWSATEIEERAADVESHFSAFVHQIDGMEFLFVTEIESPTESCLCVY